MATLSAVVLGSRTWMVSAFKSRKAGFKSFTEKLARHQHFWQTQDDPFVFNVSEAKLWHNLYIGNDRWEFGRIYSIMTVNLRVDGSLRKEKPEQGTMTRIPSITSAAPPPTSLRSHLPRVVYAFRSKTDAQNQGLRTPAVRCNVRS